MHVTFMDEEEYNNLSRYIKKIESRVFEQEIVEEKLNAVNTTKNKRGQHKYCRSCMLCDMTQGKCLADTAEKRLHYCFQARNHTILKEKGLYGQRVKKNRLT